VIGNGTHGEHLDAFVLVLEKSLKLPGLSPNSRAMIDVPRLSASARLLPEDYGVPPGPELRLAPPRAPPLARSL
jgi:hypothetical protein